MKTIAEPTFEHLNEMARLGALKTWHAWRALIARADGIAQALETGTGERFTVTVAEYGEHGAHNLDLVHESGAAISLNTGDGKIHVSGDYPKQRDGSIPYLRDDDHITRIAISASKADSVIGREIARRFWPAYLAIWQRLKADTDARGSYADQTAASVQRFATAIGARLSERDRERLGKQGEIDVYVPQKGAHRATVSGDTVRFEGLTVPVDLAIELMAKLPKG